jgi:hypothetical protein
MTRLDGIRPAAESCYLGPRPPALVHRSAAVASSLVGFILLGLAFGLDRILMIEQDVMLSLMLALAPAGVFLVFEGLLSLWREARLRAVARLEKP